ncbi:MAG: ATP-binding cassette domain-containing protein, partial [Alistipes sp.]|nr:ATP-binding cassette domain-containing protein [Alistipes sp.]
MSQSAIITLHNGIVRDPSRRMQAPINFTLEPGEQIALMGLNGSGKTTLIETLIGQRYLQQGELEFHFADPQAHASDQIRYITFRDAYGSADGSYYYQQRWNSADRDQAPQVSEFFDSVACDPAQREFLFDQLQIRKLLHKQIILLSSGELRRFQVARMLLSAPQVLVLESPFIGLDVAARRTLVDLFTTLARESNVQLILSVASPADIPPMITHVYTVEDMICGPKQRREE